MNTKHTPLPWKLGDNTTAQQIIISDVDDICIALINYWKVDKSFVFKQVEEAEANAQLISAAPDLLEALTNLLAEFKESLKEVDPGDWKMGDEGGWTDTILAAEAAITKAIV